MGNMFIADGSSIDVSQIGVAPVTSVEAQAVLDRMSALSGTEEAAIIAYVDAEVAAGNWSLIDEFYCFALNSTDWLTGFKSKTASNNAATRTANGASFNGSTSWIDSNFDLSIDSSNYTLNDAAIGVYVHTQTAAGFVYDAAITNTGWRANASGSSYGLNTASQGAFAGITSTNDKVNVNSRIDSSMIDIYIDGVFGQSITVPSTSIPAGTINIGRRSNNSTYWTGVLSTFFVGAAIGFDQSAHNTNLRAFLTALGVS